MKNNNGINVIHSARFLKAVRKLSKLIFKKVEARDILFRKNPFDSLLHTHKLHGTLSGFYAYSIDHRYRIIFSFQDNKTVMYHEIGTHRVYGAK